MLLRITQVVQHCVAEVRERFMCETGGTCCFPPAAAQTTRCLEAPVEPLCSLPRRSPVESVFHGCCFGLQSHVTRIGRVLASRLAWRHADYIVKMVSKDGVVELPFVELGKVAAPVAAGGAMEVESA